MSKKTFKEISLIRIYGNILDKKIFLGQLSYDKKQDTSAFQWSDEALKTHIEWSPIKLPLSKKIWVSGENEKDIMGLPGFIHDALPDGWGLLLMDRAFNQMGIQSHEITPLMRLAYIGTNAIGALEFQPIFKKNQTKSIKLFKLFDETKKVMINANDITIISNELLLAGGSPHGARPKIMVSVNNHYNMAIVDANKLPDNYKHVIIKFSGDGEDNTAPILEYAYNQAGKEFGLQMPYSKLLNLGTDKTPKWAFCADRFDIKNNCKTHIHSMSGMLHTTHRIANSDWTQIADILDKISADQISYGRAFKQALFNIIFCVRDDHTKNISFIREDIKENSNSIIKSQWKLSPVYDLTYSDGPGGYHTMTYAGNGKEYITYNDLLKLSKRFNIKDETLNTYLCKAKICRENMIKNAKELGVNNKLLKKIQNRFKLIDKPIYYNKKYISTLKPR